MNDELRKHTCCFFGHRRIKKTIETEQKLQEIIEKLITENGVDTFLFGSKSEFDKLCYLVVSKLRTKYSHIKRIYVRAEFPYVDNDYRAYLLEFYEDTYYPKSLINSGRAVYVERNYKMIDNSYYCVVYYDKNHIPTVRKRNKKDLVGYQPNSGTRLAYDYAKKKNVKIINITDLDTCLY